MTPARISALFDSPVGVGVTDPRRPSGSLMQGESLPRAVPKRQAEYLAGRTAARMALAAMGGPVVALPPGDDRLPIWPKGWAGSITHCDDLCLAVASSHMRALGLDVEPAQDLPADLWPEILLPREQETVAAAATPGLTARMVFCAKEAAYKAQYPLSRQIYGFHDMHLHWDAAGFQAEFLIAAGPFHPGDRLSGRFLVDSTHIVAAVALP